MTTFADPTARSAYELPLSAPDARPSVAPTSDAAALWREALLIGNVFWFLRLRWTVIAALAAFGLAGLALPGVFHALRLRPQVGWPFLAATLLLLANLGFLGHARLILRNPLRWGATWNLWIQIVGDLLVLTMVVHFLGSLETPTAFLYLAHVVLACIFFSRRRSLLVAAIASVLYAVCVGMERLQIIETPGIYLDPALRQAMTSHTAFLWLTLLSALGVYFVVWFLASHLSELVRGQEWKLAEANRRLTLAQQEKARHMLRTTHELKAPFAAIAANAQLLLKGHCGVLPEQAREVVSRIAARCRRLAVEIQEMLQLANLQSAEEQPTPTRLDLAEMVRWAVTRVGATAQERRVGVEEALEPASVVAVEDHVKMLLTNVIANAVVYSTEGGSIRVQCGETPSDGAVVVVEDEGIGIPSDKLPRIFDDYYRTEEAVRHNRDSTGLGLAIVRRVAVSHGIRVRVESAPGCGTRVTMRFPAAGRGEVA